MKATHNSATGESGLGLLSLLVAPFSRCQSKSISGQYEHGSRLFDIRAKWHKGQWHSGHGLWTSKRTFMDIVQEIAGFAPYKAYVIVTIEGDIKDYYRFVTDGTSRKVADLLGEQFVYIAVKKPQWEIVCTKNQSVADYIRTDYEILDSRNWRRFIPIPRLWAWLRHRDTEEDFKLCYTLVDFL